MVIVAVLYAILVWLVFFRLKLLPWGWLTGTVTVLVGVLVCAIFVGFLSYLAPTGRVTVISRVVEVTPNVSGQITDISVQPNQPVKAGAVLFKIDPTPYDAQVRTIEAQLKFQDLRLSQMEQLQSSSSGRAFDVEQRQAEVDQLQAQLDKAKYDLEQTTIRAPGDGYVSTLTLNKGDRATPSKSVMSFILVGRHGTCWHLLAERLSDHQARRTGSICTLEQSGSPLQLDDRRHRERRRRRADRVLRHARAGHVASDDHGISGPDQSAQGHRRVRVAARHVGNRDRLCAQLATLGPDRLASPLWKGIGALSVMATRKMLSRADIARSFQ